MAISTAVAEQGRVHFNRPSLLAWWRGILLVTAIVAAIASFLSRAQCSACNVAGQSISLFGTLLYSAAFVLTFTKLSHYLVVGGLTCALCAHAVLINSMIQVGSVCVLCLIVATGSLAAVVIGLLLNKSSWVVALIIAPLALACSYSFLGTSSWLQSHKRPEPGKAWVYVYGKAECPSCKHFDAAVLPALLKTFGSDLDVRRMDAQRVPSAMGSLPVVLVASHSSIEIVRHAKDVTECKQMISAAINGNHKSNK